MNNVRTSKLFDLSHTAAAEYLSRFDYPWEALDGIKDMIVAYGQRLDPEEYEEKEPQVWVSRSAYVAPSALIKPPTVIGARSEVRHCAYIRGGVLIGEDCVVGNSTELKNCILFDCVQVPHYNYVGDSILGYRAHMGAGAVTSNVRSDRAPVIIRDGSGEEFVTGRKKVGAMLGDLVEIGCGAVLNPGSVVGRDSIVYPLSSVRGCVPSRSIYKKDGSVVEKI